MALFLFGAALVCPHPVSADAELKVLNKLDLKSDPLDVFQSVDGQTVFILTKGELLIYSVAKQAITEKIAVDPAFDRISYTPATGAVVLSSKTKKEVQIASLEFIQKFTLAGHPFKGPENAPVVLAVFMDYQ